MTITLDDLCEGCKLSLFHYDGIMHRCPNCSAMYCDECFKKMTSEGKQYCLACGSPPRREFRRPRTL